ncbi:uncharacterized protein LOC135489555 [Lineus longissimus]|uniref:uncharacterized protein LOC135489555 n=1 Tax=Lineus longissimus TaxID=88925 RepID=UPI002B4CD6BA
MASLGSIATLSGLVAFLALLTNTVARPLSKSQHLEFPETAEEITKITEGKRKDTLLNKVILTALRDRRDGTQAQHLTKDYVRRRLDETLIHVRDLIYRANDTYNLLCYQKHALLPHNDPRLSTCRGFTQASLEIRGALNIPDHAGYEFQLDSDSRDLLKTVYHKSWEITREYQFVVSNMTTLEEDYLCNGHSCEIKCTDRIRNSDPHSFLCQLRTLESRIISFSKILVRSMNMLHLSPKSNRRVFITGRPEVSEHTRLMYNFAASYQLYRQAEEIEYAIQLTRNTVS